MQENCLEDLSCQNFQHGKQQRSDLLFQTWKEVVREGIPFSIEIPCSAYMIGEVTLGEGYSKGSYLLTLLYTAKAFRYMLLYIMVQGHIDEMCVFPHRFIKQQH